MDISSILTQARSSNDEIRRSGEQKIEQAAMENFGQFLIILATEISDDSKDKDNRKLAATLIKNMLNYFPKFVGKWNTLNDSVKNEVKQKTLSTLASQNVVVRKSAAIAVAGIYKCEHPNNQWPELIDILVATCSNENIDFQTSAIMTLGYISQEINIQDFKVEDVDKILSGLIETIREPKSDEVLKASLISFVNYISFARKNFAKDVSIMP